jgi:5-methylcytosine-specific restriction endonuclease McrA
MSVDHVIARYNGGTDDDSNLAAAHSLCNSRKGIS